MACKRLFAVLAAFAASAALLCPAGAADLPGALPPVRGDVDRSGKVDAADARQALRFSVGLDTELLPLCLSADYDGDGRVTATDARLILRCSVGLEEGADRYSFPGACSCTDADLDAAIASVLHRQYRSQAPDGLIHAESFALLAEETDQTNEKTVYLLVCHMTFCVSGSPEEVTCSIVPAAITFSLDENETYSLKAYRAPAPGRTCANEIRAIFPAAAADRALHPELYAETLKKDCLDQANRYLEGLAKT